MKLLLSAKASHYREHTAVLDLVLDRESQASWPANRLAGVIIASLAHGMPPHSFIPDPGDSQHSGNNERTSGI